MTETENAAFEIITNAILKLRREFMAAGLEPPKSIELSGREDWSRLRYIMDRHMHSYPTIERGGPEMKANIYGVDIFAPVKRRPEDRGGFTLE